MYDDKSIEAAMHSARYARQSKFIYKASFGTEQVEHFVFFSIDSRGHLGGRFGLRNPFLEEFGSDAIIKYGHPNRRIIRQFRDPQIACTLSFEFARIDNYSQTVWRRFRAKDYAAAEVAAVLAGFVEQQVVPLVQDITDQHALFGFLVSDREPTPWIVSAPAARAAQVTALATQLRLEKDAILDLLSPYARMIAADLLGDKIEPDHPAGSDMIRYVDRLLLDLKSYSCSAPS